MAFPIVLGVSQLGKSFGAEQIFSDVTFQLAEREHAALVGVNGAGKSTLLRIIAGIDDAQRGTVALAGGARVYYQAQEPNFSSERTVREEARLGFAEALQAGARMHEIEHAMAEAAGDDLDALLSEYDRLQIRFEAAGGYDVEHRTDEVLMGLGFTENQFNEPVEQLSGGQKTRVALAKALLTSPDLLLLDEPTNHLDLAMVEWLEEFLRSWNGACLIVSHDRYFLDRVTNRTLDLSFGRLEDYPAPYARYLDLREERMTRRLQEYEEQQAFIARTEEFIRKYKAGQRSREARGRQTRLDRLERIDRPQEHEGLNLKLNPAIRSGREVLSMSPLRAGYIGSDGQQLLVQTPELTIERGDRVALVGPNGSGKSTLLRTLIGEIPALKGRIGFGANVKPGYYAQGHERLPNEGTPLSVLLDTQPMGEEAARTYLGRFLFSDDDVFKRIGSLSGGERSRLALACLMLQQANFLILDEPTNHLDIHTRETLEAMLQQFEGTVLLVSHDRFFIDQVATRVWAIQNGALTPYLGNYTDYQRHLNKQTTPKPEPVSEPAPVRPASEPRPARRPRGAAAEKQLAQAEREIARLEGRLNELSDALTVASIDADVAAVDRLGVEYARAQEDLESAYANWEELSAEAELVASG
ncbi:MAG: ABC-F family ATP-binding cassette domain-containing protein [Thermomicrobiales bacterium]|nr:ABC-F family ATP-binding cassette domain-containing protein [Thermomicrobiales bacterium]